MAVAGCNAISQASLSATWVAAIGLSKERSFSDT